MTKGLFSKIPQHKFQVYATMKHQNNADWRQDLSLMMGVQLRPQTLVFCAGIMTSVGTTVTYYQKQRGHVTRGKVPT